MLAASPAASCGAEIAVMRNAIVAASGIVLSSDGRVVRETLDGTTKWQRFFPFCRDAAGVIQIDIRGRFSLMKRVDGMTAVLLRSAFDTNYGHWLVECLPKLDEVSRHFNLGDCYVLVSAGYDHMGKVFHESLGLLGIPTRRILELTYAPVSFETLVYPLPITSHPWTKSPAIIEFLERLGARVPRDPNAPGRIYVSRKLAHQRRLQNEQDVLDVAQLHGFKVIYPETLSLTEQIRLFSAAEIVIGPCGAGLTNLVFAPRGVVLLALTAEWMQDDFFWDLTDLKEGEYCSLHGRSLGVAGDYNADFEIDLAAFHPIFEACLGKLPRGKPFCH